MLTAPFPINQINTEVITWENHRKHYLLEHIYLIYPERNSPYDIFEIQNKIKAIKIIHYPLQLW